MFYTFTGELWGEAEKDSLGILSSLWLSIGTLHFLPYSMPNALFPDIKKKSIKINVVRSFASLVTRVIFYIDVYLLFFSLVWQRWFKEEFSFAQRHGVGNMRSLVTLHGQEVDEEDWQCSTCLYIFLFSGTPTHDIVPLYSVWDLATSVKAPWKHPHRHAQTFVS